MFISYPWNSFCFYFVLFLEIIFLLKVALLWSGNLKYPNACFPRWSRLKLPPSLDVPGLDWLGSFSGLICMYSASSLGGKRVGDGSGESRALSTPAVASFEADVLCLHCCHCRVLTPLAVASRRALSCCDTLHPTPRPSLLQTVGEERWPGAGTHLSSA